MVEGAPLLREYTGNGIEGSNPFLSATTRVSSPNHPCRTERLDPERLANMRELAGENRGSDVPEAFPDIVVINGRAVIQPFHPGSPAFEWRERKRQTGTIYLMEAAGLVKIGITQNFARRLEQVAGGMPFPVRKLATRSVALLGLKPAEKWMHHQFRDRRVKGEWFSIDPEEAKALLPKAVRYGQIWSDCCGEWLQDLPASTERGWVPFDCVRLKDTPFARPLRPELRRVKAVSSSLAARSASGRTIRG